ncbi:hypothetical protein JOD63_002936 [Microbacterium terrae]|uniref:Tannase and feruloyl esterase n=1 Tax=Microbacterium terrae TaxID=69369 RepID=A0A0M2H3K8_9MICO|nr:hypothetical protein [Microbacterium terrae]KJL38390.1 hypothetical protein RS81_02661 [Microbacterium terrae]MBP1078968.1 hypothetical protein [Microbacterium terrae]GLJ98368.1 hypothetical protein GCM10017594_15650 [Microbacterium terrae]
MTITAAASLTGVSWSPDAEDDAFQQPYVDIDEERDWPVRHRYVHGGFHDNETRFSLYLPPAGQFEGRFFQHVTPVPQSENLAQDESRNENPVPFTIASGGYFVETNGGGPSVATPMAGGDPTIGAYRANAAAARLSRQIAAQVFGPQRIYGYLYGGSGGGYRTIGASENTQNVWDGFVPYVIGSPMAVPNVFAVRMHAQRILRDKFPAIVNAYDVGGDPATLDLSDEERAAFEEVSRMGFPVKSWFGWQSMGMHAFSVLYPGIMMADPSYADDFWTVDGYLGADPAASVHKDRIRLHTRITDLLTETGSAEDRPSGGVDESFKATTAGTSAVTGVRLSDAPSGWALGAELHVLTGEAAGATLRLSAVDGDTVRIEPGQVLDALRVGDEVLLDNSSFLAAQTYHRHQVPADGYPVWDQFRHEDGTPQAPQRQMLLGPLFASAAAGTVQTGHISGKMIVVASLLDREAFPWQADWYRTQVSAFLGDTVDDRFRLWYTDNALHGDESGIQEHETHTITYVPVLQAALRQLSAWVEQGIEPADNTAYEILDGQVLVSDTDPNRGGVQPVVTVTANGSAHATVRPGEPVQVRIEATAATGAGMIVQVATDLTGAGTLTDPFDVQPAVSVTVERSTTFDQPGTYFIAARVTAQTGNDDTVDPHARVFNIARARVTVAD